MSRDAETALANNAGRSVPEREYRRRIRAWTLYDWANSAFATTIMAALLPAYYSSVAAATLPSESAATALWSLGLSASLLLIALASPVLGALSDVTRSKKWMLAVFAGLGVVGTAFLVLVSRGDWPLALGLLMLARIGYNGANIFYDALLPHVARPEDRDSVSARGYALGYLGGGLLLAINIVMLEVVPEIFPYAGPRLSFLSVAVWWALFTVPLLVRVPEPPAASGTATGAGRIIAVSVGRLIGTLRDIRRYRELFIFLLAFLIYNDGIGTIIGLATIYGAELGLGTIDLVLALLLVQFVGIPFSLIFGRIPGAGVRRGPQFLALVVANAVLLPLCGIAGARLLPHDLTGAPPQPFLTEGDAVGQGTYGAQHPALACSGSWRREVVPKESLSGGAFLDAVNAFFGERIVDVTYSRSEEPGARLDLTFHGLAVEVVHAEGPGHGVWDVEVDGRPHLDARGKPVRIDARSDSERYGTVTRIEMDAPGRHVLSIVSRGDPPGCISVASIKVLGPPRRSQLGSVFLILLGIQAVSAAFAMLLGARLFSGLAALLDTKRCVILALSIYAVISAWGFVLDSTLEFWFLAWLVATVQGGSQALSRSLYSSMSPAAKSGEFFGLFGVMEKFSAVLGPLVFAFTAAFFGSSRPGILGLVAFFIVGIVLLRFVDVKEGCRRAREEDARLLGQEGQGSA